MDDALTKLVTLARRKDLNSLTLTELSTYLGLKHRSQAKHYKERALREKLLVLTFDGKLVPAPTVENPTLITLPVYGEANCGPASAFADNHIQGTISVSPSALRRRPTQLAFAVTAKGDSMNRANINGKTLEGGDIAVVEPSSWGNAADGDYVLSVIDGMSNIKKLKIDTINRQIILKSESIYDSFEDIILHADDLYLYRIAGRVTDVIKSKLNTY